MAIPWMPLVLGISPTGVCFSMSTTWTCVPRDLSPGGHYRIFPCPVGYSCLFYSRRDTMKIKFTALPLLLLLTCIQSGRAGGAGGDTTLTRILEDKSSEFISTAVVPAGRTGPLVFKQYAELVMMELRRSGGKRVEDQL